MIVFHVFFVPSAQPLAQQMCHLSIYLFACFVMRITKSRSSADAEEPHYTFCHL